MRLIKYHILIISFFFASVTLTAFAQDKNTKELQGEINSEGINVRVDATASSEVICKLNKGEYVDIVGQRYNWYKIRLPAYAPMFVKKNLVAVREDKTGRVLKNKINVRSRADMESPILGKVNDGETVKVLGESDGWLKIEAVQNSFGWVHENFITKVEKRRTVLTGEEHPDITVEGTIRPKTFTRVATHKLIAEQNKVYLIKGNKEELNSYNGLKVRIHGKVVDPSQVKTPIVEAGKIEALP